MLADSDIFTEDEKSGRAPRMRAIFSRAVATRGMLVEHVPRKDYRVGSNVEDDGSSWVTNPTGEYNFPFWITEFKVGLLERCHCCGVGWPRSVAEPDYGS